MHFEEAAQLWKNEFPTLKDTCYLDHTGATLYAKSQIAAVSQDLCENIYGNPHSLSLSSRYCSDVIDQERFRILQYFKTSSEEYSVIFTSGATGALKLVGECFDWGSNAALNDEERAGTSQLKNCCGAFVYLQDNHTSVIGMRELACRNGANTLCLPHNTAFEIFNAHGTSIGSKKSEGNCQNSLFVYPAQCNFSGVKYPLSWIDKVHQGALDEFAQGNMDIKKKQNSKWFCFLDAATYVSTNNLDLSLIKPDFVCISFYKIFGYPTGLGALLVKNSSADVLKKTYFGGGSVLISLSSERFHIARPNLSDKFEDGTLPFLSIAALRHGFDALQKLAGGMDKVALRTFSLARYIYLNLMMLHHSNGAPVAVVYGDTDYEDVLTQGNIVNFNLLRSNKEFVGFMEVLNMANLFGIHLRTGCFCNPGACQRHLSLSTEDLQKHFQAGHVCGDERDLIDGQPTGSIRISFGYMSTEADAEKFLDMIMICFVDVPKIMKLPEWWENFRTQYQKKFFPKKKLFHNNEDSNKSLKKDKLHNRELEAPSNIENGVSMNELQSGSNVVNGNACGTSGTVDFLGTFLSHLFLYPVKSCGAVSVKSWTIGSRGLIYDREWMIVTPSGVSLTQKQETKLCLVQPEIDLQMGWMKLHFPGMDPVSLPLEQPDVSSVSKQAALCQSKVCGDCVQGWDCGDEVAEWLSLALGRDGLRLIRQRDNDQRISKSKKLKNDAQDEKSPSLSLSNQAQFLLVNEASVKWLRDKLVEETDRCKEGLLDRFRCNLGIQGFQPFEEKEWSKLIIGGTEFIVDGPCTRCQMICIDQATGERTREPLRTLSALFHGKMRFGIYLKHSGDENVKISVGDKVVPFF